MSPTTVSDLIKGIQNSWKKYRQRPTKAPDKFLIEACFMRQFLASDCARIRDDGTGGISVSTYGREKTYECHRFVLTGDDSVDGPTGKTLYFHYFDGKGLYRGDNYGLIIQDCDNNVLYWREAGQKPRTEWVINCLAEDLEDGNGNFVFTGEPVTI